MPDQDPEPVEDGGEDDDGLSHEESIFLLAKEGYLEAQSQLVMLHQVMVRSYVATICGNPNISDDLAQETFLRTLGRLDRVKTADRLPAFLRGVARNVVREHFRRMRSRKTVADRFLKWAETQWEAHHDDRWASGAGDCGLKERLQICLDRLPTRSRSLIRMRYEKEMNSTEISRTIPMKPEAVRTAIGRIRRKLQSCLESLDPAT